MKNISSVIIVEDSEPDQFLCKIMLERYDPDIEILQAYDGQEALDILSKCDKQPDMILLDINMPGMDGYEFLDTYCKDTYCNTPDCNKAKIVMLTSSAYEGDRKRSMAYGCVSGYIMKPLTIEKLQKAIKT